MAEQQKIESGKVYTVCEVAGVLKTSSDVVYRIIKSKKLRSKKVGSGRGIHRILGEWVMDYINN